MSARRARCARCRATRAFALSGRALIEARQRGDDLDDALAAKVGWTRFEAAVARAEALSGPELVDPTAELVARHRSVRVFGPRLLDAFCLRGVGRGQGPHGRA